MSFKDFNIGCLISGNLVNIDETIAYCHCDAHRGYLNKQLLKSHECIKKECSFLEKINLDYWDNLEFERKKRIEKRKNGLFEKKLKTTNRKNRDEQIKLFLEFNKPIKITAIIDEPKKPLRICFTSDNYIDFKDILPILRDISGKGVYLKRVFK